MGAGNWVCLPNAKTPGWKIIFFKKSQWTGCFASSPDTKHLAIWDTWKIVQILHFPPYCVASLEYHQTSFTEGMAEMSREGKENMASFVGIKLILLIREKSLNPNRGLSG